MIDYTDIVFQDTNLIAVNKRCNVPVIPARGNQHVLSLREHIEEFVGEKLFVVHRIDRATSGVVVFAKNAETHRLLCKQFENRTVKKEYIAVIIGIMSGEGILESPIKQFGSSRMGVHKDGKPSKTGYRVIEQFERSSMVRLFLYTGRRHQIRVHLYNEGHPVLGDPLYGKDRPVGGVGRLMLHAHSISFLYPEEKQLLITAPFNDVWNETVNRLKRNSPIRENY